MMQALVELNLHRKCISPLKSLSWTSPVIQGLGLHPFTARSADSTTGRGIKISHARRPKIKIKKKFLFVLDIMPCKVITYLPNQFWDSVYLFKHVIIWMMTLLGCLFTFDVMRNSASFLICLFSSCFCSSQELSAFNLCLLFIFSSLGYKLHETRYLSSVSYCKQGLTHSKYPINVC